MLNRADLEFIHRFGDHHRDLLARSERALGRHELRCEVSMGGSVCPECGATYAADEASCTARFEQLLALDHSRQEPWGSRHGQAFAAFALQHPGTYARSLDHAWAVLVRIYLQQARPAQVVRELVAARGALPAWAMPARPAAARAAPTVTIKALGDFAAARYAEQLDAWCRATLEAWGVAIRSPAP